MAGPMYRQIAEDLELKIASGELDHGAKLPAELALQEEYGASRNTIRDAIKSLVIRGLVETRSGKGTFVVDKIDPFVNTLIPLEGGRVGDASTFYIEQVKSRRRRADVLEPEVRVENAAARVAESLGVKEGDPVVARHQKRTIDGRPWSRQTSYYPLSYVNQGATRLLEAKDITEGTVAYLKQTLGIEQVGFRDFIAMRTPDASETDYFGLPSDRRVPVFEITRAAFDQNGNAFRVTITTYPADRNLFMIEIGDVPAGGDTGQPLPAPRIFGHR